MTIALPIEGTGPPSPDIRRRVETARVLSLKDRDELLHGLVLGYRSGDRPLWAPLILELMETSVRIRVSRYRPEGPTMAMADVYQDLVCALLEDALSIPLDGPAFLERRLLLRSADRVSRGLQAEARYQEEIESLEGWAGEQANDDTDEEDPR
jgi:hypothetical protein